ncbi:MAG TPA: hypothetical protein PLE54_02155 [Burkholderiaceae bacterium]|nr:hypothetical protein [Burkholderiaceae bacterium]HQR69380.1 hypothetical protein [Burkholderiaceae bacterium]
MSKRLLLLAGLTFAAAAPLAAHAYTGVSVAVSTPEFGFRIGAPWYGPVYAPPVAVPVPVFPTTVYAPPPVIYAPAPVVMPPPRIVYPAPVFVPAPRVVYPRAYMPPRTVVPYGHERYEHGVRGQEAAYRMPPGQMKRYAYDGRYQ